MAAITRRIPNWIRIESDDPRIVRQSRLLQVLVTIISIFGYYQLFVTFAEIQADPSQTANSFITIVEGLVVVIFGTVTFYLLHRGHFMPALHLFFIVLNGLLYSLLVETGKDSVFPYLLLLSVFTIASLQSNWISALYLVLITIAVAIFYATTAAEVVGDTGAFIRLSLFLCAPIWFFGNDLRQSRDRNQRLALELENTVSNLDSQAKQLAQIAEVGRVATASLESKQLLGNVVDLIQKQFNFYYVAVLLISPDGTKLILEEASGETGRIVKDESNYLTIGKLSIVGWVAINRKARIALDVGEDAYHFNYPNLPETHSEVALPLTARGRILGVLDVHSRQSSAFQEEDLAALQVMADQIASGLGNAQLFNEISNQATVLTELQAVTNLMNQQANTKNALHVLADKLPPLFNADGGGVFLYDPEINRLKLTVNLNIDDTRPGRSLAPGEGLSGWVYQENKSHMVDDYLTWAGRSEDYVQVGFHAALSVPLRQQNEPFGVLSLTRSQKNNPFKQDDVQIAELLAAQIAAVIINNQLIDETRKLVQRERTINQAAAQIRRSLDAKTILDTTTAELGNLLSNKIVRAKLFSEEESQQEDQVVS